MYSNKIKGIFWFFISRLALVALVIFARYLAGTINPIQIATFQNIFALLFFLPIFFKRGVGCVFNTKNLVMHSIRGFISVAGVVIWYYCFTRIPLPDALAISYSLPLFVTLFAMIFLKEHLVWSTVVSLLIGFLGMLIIIRPSFDTGLTFIHLLVILSTSFLAIANILNKILVDRKETPYAIVFYMSLTAILFTFPYTIRHYIPMNFAQMLLFIFLGFLSNISYLTTSISYSEDKKIGYLQPFDFIRLVLVVCISRILFNETISQASIIGVAIILLSEQILFIVKRKEDVIIKTEEKVKKLKKECIPNDNRMGKKSKNRK